MNTKPIPKHQKRQLEVLGVYLRNLRINHNMTIWEVSEQIPLHRNTIQRIESGSNSTLLSVIVLAEYFEVKTSELLSIID